MTAAHTACLGEISASGRVQLLLTDRLADLDRQITDLTALRATVPSSAPRLPPRTPP